MTEANYFNVHSVLASDVFIN